MRQVVPIVLLGFAAACASSDGPNTREATATAASPQSGDWVTYNGPLAGDRYSPLTQITTANVGQLRQHCVFGAPEAVNFQSGIVAVKGVLYFTLFNHTYAIDATTCQQRWKHTRPEPDTFLMVNRGVAYSDGRLFRGTGDAHVLAIDAADGKQLWDVSIGDAKKGESVPMAPIAWNGLVFAGNAGGDNFGVIGRIYALDAKIGRLLAYVQPLEGDFHDWDLATAPALITTKSGRPFVASASKDGHVYNIDRTAVTTQTSDPPSADQLVIRSKALVTTSENADTPLSTEHETRFRPGVQGGVEWNGPSYHPGLGLLFVNAIDWCTYVKMQPLAKIKGAPGDAWTGAEPADGWLFGRHDPVEQARGWVTAVDAESGEIKWKIQTPRPMQ